MFGTVESFFLDARPREHVSTVPKTEILQRDLKLIKAEEKMIRYSLNHALSRAEQEILMNSNFISQGFAVVGVDGMKQTHTSLVNSVS